jgi:predicted pyridoxine 5'-phosphate oxidase superfamily flavin-nucleotide-binding protein
VLDRHTLAFGDRKGNHRLDSLRNIVANPQVGLLFLVPGVGDTLRVNGTARIVAGAGYLPELACGGVVPHLAIEVVVEEFVLHCTKAFGRSALWDHASWPVKGAVPSAGQIVRSQHPRVTVPAAEIDAALERAPSSTATEITRCRTPGAA